MMLLANAAPYTVFPGELPNYQWEKPLIDMSNGILRRTAAPATLLEDTQRVVNTRLSEAPAAWVVERRYGSTR